jgi:23S rRNA-/tRNA-specific pseudouridylate synthase
MSEGCSKIEDVCLFWDVPTNCDHNHYIVNISLRPVQSSGEEILQAASMPSSLSNEITPSTINDTPESVLLFERALRKAEHAKKAGKYLSANDIKIVYKDDHIIVVVRKRLHPCWHSSRHFSQFPPSFVAYSKEQTTWCAHCTRIAFTGKYINVNS